MIDASKEIISIIQIKISNIEYRLNALKVERDALQTQIDFVSENYFETAVAFSPLEYSTCESAQRRIFHSMTAIDSSVAVLRADLGKLYAQRIMIESSLIN